MYKKGTIVLVPFPFAEQKAYKVRPAVIVSAKKYNTTMVSLVFISSVVPKKKTKTDIILRQTDSDFKKTGLKTDSVIIAQKIATVDKSLVLGELGALTKKDQDQLDRQLRFILDL